jgi:serine/threonine protein kinase
LYKEVNERHFVKRRLQGPGPKYNEGYDDQHGHYLVMNGEEIAGRFVVQDVLGKGSFGTVVRCVDSRHREPVALKITRNGHGFRQQARMEVEILTRLREVPEMRVVRLRKVFDWKGHLVLVFDMLSFNLYQLIQCTNYHGVSLDLVSKFAIQMLLVLRDLQRLGIIHCDLKPENVLLLSQNRSAIRVIDFGSACYVSKRPYKYIQSRYYRSPEVILHLDYGTAIDRWSLGCILVELHTGLALFDGRSELQQLQRFEALLGPIPPHLIANSPKRETYYEPYTAPTGETRFRLKTQGLDPVPQRSLREILERARDRRKQQLQQQGSSSQQQQQQRSYTPALDPMERYSSFIDLVLGLLRFDPAERIAINVAIEHPFVANELRAALLQPQQQPAAGASQQPQPAAGATQQPPSQPAQQSQRSGQPPTPQQSAPLSGNPPTNPPGWGNPPRSA